jgi:hypothetical protein
LLLAADFMAGMIKLMSLPGDHDYLLEPDTGTYSRRRNNIWRKPDGNGFAGCAHEDFLQDSVGGRTKVLVACYSDGEHLILSIGRDKFLLDTPGVRVEKTKPDRRSTKVSIIARDRVLFDGLFSWPLVTLMTPPSTVWGDAFDFAIQTMESRARIYRTIYVFWAINERRNEVTPAFEEQVDQYAARRVAAEKSVPQDEASRAQRSRAVQPAPEPLWSLLLPTRDDLHICAIGLVVLLVALAQPGSLVRVNPIRFIVVMSVGLLMVGPFFRVLSALLRGLFLRPRRRDDA